ncbi:MAG: hypothetical protein JWR68_3404 [Polaromonas sp.]|nr:hypothetical protein [Polaromonas sp.]
MTPAINEHDIPNGETDYLELPQFGAQYFNLEDAALLAALDEWWRVNGGDDPDFDELVSNHEARKAAQPLQQKILKALLRAASAKELAVKVFARELGSGEPIPVRTYAPIGELRELLQVYGLGNGHLIEWAESLDDEVYDLALSIYRRRSLIKYGLMPGSREALGTNLMEQHQQLQQKFDSQNLKIAHLERRLNHVAGDSRPLMTTERNTLLTIIAALAKAAKLTIDSPGKAALSIEGMTDELDAHVSKRAIEEHLKKIPDALAGRMK